MNRTIQMDENTFEFSNEKEKVVVTIPTSRTNVKEINQLALLQKSEDGFVPLEMSLQEDMIIMEYFVSDRYFNFEKVKQMERVDQLRLLLNIAKLHSYLRSRYTFFLHPDNLVFDDNFFPRIIHRGMKGLLPPYEITGELFLKQYKCFIMAVFSKKYRFEDLYNGNLINSRSTKFEKSIANTSNLNELVKLLEDIYIEEKKNVERNMKRVPKKKFRLFKGLAVGFIMATIVLLVPLVYFTFIKVPYQEKLLTANEAFLKTEYEKVISALENEEPQNLPLASQYMLAYSYLQGENLDEKKKENIFRNISLKSDAGYLLYWIYNGQGDFEKSLDIAKVIDDIQLIMYSLTKELEQVKNNATLSGNEKMEQQTKIEEELDKYSESLKKDHAEARAE